MLVHRRVFRVSEVDAVAAVLHRICKPIFDFPSNQFPGGLMFKFRRAEMLDSRHLGQGEINELYIHG